MDGPGYIHGYSGREAERLSDQARILRPLLHDGVAFPDRSRVLEPGCGTGRQTEALLERNPGIRITALDIDAGQLSLARARIGDDARVTFHHGDLTDAPFADASFDHAFVCFLLEHLNAPEAALAALRRMVRPGGRIVVIEGDHGSCRFHPETDAARRAWESLPACQRRSGGDPDIGRRLCGLLSRSGFAEVAVEPRLVYADATLPELRDGFVRRIIVPMVEGMRDTALRAGLVDDATWSQGIADLDRTADGADGVFCYTFFRASARVP